MSKFSGLTASRRKPEEASPDNSNAEVLSTHIAESAEVQNAKTSAAAEPINAEAERPAAPQEPRRGRPKAKRSDPSYMQVTAYVRKDTYRAIKGILFNHEGEREFSDLVETLLVEYAKSRT